MDHWRPYFCCRALTSLECVAVKWTLMSERMLSLFLRTQMVRFRFMLELDRDPAQSGETYETSTCTPRNGSFEPEIWDV